MKKYYNTSKGQDEEPEEDKSSSMRNDPKYVMTMFRMYYVVCQNMIKEGLMNADGRMSVEQAKAYIEKNKKPY